LWLLLCYYLGIYFGEPRGFGTNENGEEIGFNTEIYATHEVSYYYKMILLHMSYKIYMNYNRSMKVDEGFEASTCIFP